MEELSDVNILVTGASGFVGSNLIRALAEFNPKAKITALLRKTSNIDGIRKISNIGYLYGDINDRQFLEKNIKDIDIIYHLAGLLGKYGVATSNYYAVNVNGTKNIAAAGLNSRNLKQFIHLSSAGVLGPDVQNADETFPLKPSNIYEMTKAEAEKIIFNYYKEGLPVTILRPEFLYGPGDKHILGLFKTIKRRMFFLINDGKSFLHPTYIGDLIQALLKCCGNKKTLGRVYLVAGQRRVTVREFTGFIAKYLGVKRINMSMPKKKALLFARAFETLTKFFKLNPPLTVSRVNFFSQNRSYNIARAKKELGFNPIPLEEGIRRTIDWYKLRGFL